MRPKPAHWQEGFIGRLRYTAEYDEKTAEDLENLFYTQSTKGGSSGLVVKADSLVDAKKRLADHLGEDVEINQTQVVILLGEQFTAKALAVCNYLNKVLKTDLCSFECWRYSVYIDGTEYFLAIEQLLPPPNARVLIEERREDSKSRKYARDPVRVSFMQAMVAGLANTEFKAALRANMDETDLLVVITEQGENRNPCEEQRNIFGFSCFSPGFARLCAT